MWGDSDPNDDVWLSHVQKLAPLVGEARDVGERERRLPRVLFEALRDADLLRVSTPRAVGGLELPEGIVVRIVEELSRLDGAVGWCERCEV